MIIGGPGSGKSTLARRLGAITGLPVFHMDLIHWRPGWEERPRAEKDRMTREVHRRDAWIFEGGHSRTYPERIARADTCIWLDLPIALRCARVVKRWWHYRGESRPDLPKDCPERLDPEFFRYILSSRARVRARNVAIEAAAPHLAFYHLRSPAAVRRFLAGLAPPPSPGARGKYLA